MGAFPQSVRREIYKRDEGRCLLCGSAEDLQAHHINGDPTDRSLENGALLCHFDHSRLAHMTPGGPVARDFQRVLKHMVERRRINRRRFSTAVWIAREETSLRKRLGVLKALREPNQASLMAKPEAPDFPKRPVPFPVSSPV